MTDKVVQLYPQKHPISHIVRVGKTGHRALANLHAANKVPLSRVVVDATHVEKQRELIGALYDSNVEIILDTNAAELAMPIGMHTSAGQLPWAGSAKKHWWGDWKGRSQIEKVEQLAKFCVEAGVSAVLSPSHYLDSTSSKWLSVDLDAVSALRNALDANGGQTIRIDYHLSMPVSMLRELEYIQTIGQLTESAPIGNIWVRVSNYGMSGSPLGTKRFIEAAWELGKTGKPIIGDNVGGLTGMSLAAFGAIGGICHGITEKENFNISAWQSQPSGGSRRRRIYFPQLDMYLYQEQAQILLKGVGAKRLALCKDCCRTVDNMIINHRLHAVTQSHRQVRQLNAQPELKRKEYMIDEVLPETIRTLKKAGNIKLEDEALTNKVKKRFDRTDLLLATLENVASESGSVPISLEPIGSNWINKVG